MTGITAAVERLNWFVEGMEESFPSQEPDVRYLWSQRLADIRQLIAAVPQWQPIETAPKDGTVLLGLFNGKDHMETIAYNHGWYYASDGDSPDATNQPTHWMPLPPPPQPNEGE